MGPWLLTQFVVVEEGVKVYQDNVPFFLAYLTTRLYVGCVCGMIVLLYPLL